MDRGSVTVALTRSLRALRQGCGFLCQARTLALGGLAAAAALLVWTVAQAAISYVSFSQNSSTGVASSIVLNVPAGTAANDYMIATVGQIDKGTLAPPSGWTTLLTSDGDREPRTRIFTRVATGAEPASYTFTSTKTAPITGGISTFRGVDTTSPIAASAILGNGSSASATAPSIGPAVANTLLVAVWSSRGALPTAPAGMATTVSANSGSGDTAYVVSAYEFRAASGATGTRSATLSKNKDSNGALIALRPAASSSYAISGTVFEDLNYGGGAGRNKATVLAAGGSARPNARVELATVSGTTATVVASTTTDASGNYSFTGLAAGNYGVRVVSGTVTSARSGYVAGLLPVTTFRITGTSGSAVDVTNEVGGSSPSVTAYASTNASVGATSSTTVPDAEAVSYLTLGSASLSGVDFGYNFDTVTNTNDSGQGSLRQTITNANTLGSDAGLAQSGRTAAVENLIFMLPNGTTGSGGSLSLTGGLSAGQNAFTAGIATIAPGSVLPTISTTMVIDARTQPGWTSTPIIELNGSGAGASINGLNVSASSATLAGLVINRYTGSGISITAGSGVKVVGNYVGTNAAGTAAAANAGSGISMSSGSHTIGGTSAADRNLISGNAANGVLFSGAGGSVIGNYIGVNAAGTAAVANGHGVYFFNSAGGTIGGAAAGAGNLISGNTNHGIFAWSGSPTTTLGNTIGLNAAGSAAIPNGTGVFFQFHTSGTIGGTTAAARNVISGNTGAGVNIVSHGGHTITGNYIGTNPGGTAAFPNGGGGLVIAGSGSNTIGGTAAGAGNVISGNTGAGLTLSSTSNSAAGNLIGLNATGTAALANSSDGISVSAANNTLGGNSGSARNVIAGNGGAGIRMTAGSATIQGNYIGVASDGSTAAGNANNGIYVSGIGATTTIGGSAAGAGNVIANNTGKGIAYASGATALTISRNAIYANTSIGIDLSNNGVTANDGAKTTGQANLAMDSPVITVARVRGSQLTVAGHVGTAAGQSLFAGSVVEVFVSDADSSGFGEGRTYLGTLTADGAGNFSGTVTMPYSALRAGSVLTGTATDTANNTSEFGANFSGLIVDWLINDNGDGVDAIPGDGLCETSTAGQCTLRAAIMEANAWAGADLAAFNLPICPGAGCVITPSSALPTITGPLTLDGQTQPGWTLAPLVDLRGESAGAGSNGLSITAASTVIRGLAVGGFLQSGIHINANDVTVEGVYAGIAPDGVTVRANGANNSATGGVYVAGGSGIVIGGTTAARRNVLSGNGGGGVWTQGGTATIIGNHIGIDASGTAARGNGRWGVHLEAGTGHKVGGSASGEGNLISGNSANQNGGVYLLGTGHIVQGNTIGLNAARASAIPNGDASSTNAAGIDARSGSGHLIGGTNAGEGNVIAGNQGYGVSVRAQSTRVLGNSIYGNLWLGIDLNANGVTPNNGTASTSLPNNDMDHPVITSAGYDPGTRALTVTGYIGTGTGQAIFAGARVELFTSDGDATGHGEGSNFVGALTADANGRFSGSVTVPVSVSFAVGTPLTGTATDTSNNTSEFGPNVITTTMSALAPSRFNAFETGTLAGALTGVIQTRVAGVAGNIAVIAIDNSGTVLQTSFAGTVTLEWMNASDNSGALDAGNCRASWVASGSAGSIAFVSGDLGRRNTALTPTTVGREWRLRMSYAGPGSTVTSCSTDAFAVRPDTLAITGVTDANDTTAGTTRVLDNLAASGGRVHRAGRPFSLRAAARDAANALATGYDGIPTIAITGCVLPSGCTAGTLTAPALVASGGLIGADTLSYSEVGAINLQLTDDSFADIDAADTALAQRRIQSSALGVGRFVPDRYLLAAANAPQFATQQSSCAVAGQGFTFVGQNFGWATPPSFTITAQNAAGTTTALWSGALQKVNPTAHVARSLAAANAQGLTPVVTWGTMTLTDAGSGVATVALAGDQFLFTRNASAPVASFNPIITLSMAVSDSSETAVSGNTAVAGTTALVIGSGTGIAFNQGSSFHYARLKLQNAFGDVRRGVRANVELQKFTDRGWLRLNDDNTCITVPQAGVAFSAGGGAFATDVCTAPATGAIALRQGRGTLVLPKTAGNIQGAAMVTLNIGSTLEGSACAAGVPVAPTSVAWPHLLGARGTGLTQDQNPAARLVWGRQHRDYMTQRELF